jgi:predicted nucleic acid-binding protein
LLVVDASVMVNLVLDMPPYAASIAERLRDQPTLVAPHLLDAEVASVLRSRVLEGQIPSAGALSALSEFFALSIERYPHTPLLWRAFELRDNATVYDALYLALAEALGATLLTSDRALARVPGSRLGSRCLPDRGHLPSTAASIRRSISLLS